MCCPRGLLTVPRGHKGEVLMAGVVTLQNMIKSSLIAMMLAAASVGATQAQSITQALTAAYDHAPDLQSALLSAKSSAENIAQAQSRKLPTIGASIAGNQQFSLSGGNWSTGSAITTGLSYNQTIFDNYRTEAQIEAARAAAEV